jgi:hypothetical protein
MDDIQIEHMKFRLNGIMDAILHKDTHIRYQGLLSLLGLTATSPRIGDLLAELTPEQRAAILDIPE